MFVKGKKRERRKRDLHYAYIQGYYKVHELICSALLCSALLCYAMLCYAMLSSFTKCIFGLDKLFVIQSFSFSLSLLLYVFLHPVYSSLLSG